MNLFVRYCSHPDGHTPEDCPDRNKDGEAGGRTCQGCGKPMGCVPFAGRGYWHLDCFNKARNFESVLTANMTCLSAGCEDLPQGTCYHFQNIRAAAGQLRAAGHDVLEVKRG